MKDAYSDSWHCQPESSEHHYGVKIQTLATIVQAAIGTRLLYPIHKSLDSVFRTFEPMHISLFSLI